MSSHKIALNKSSFFTVNRHGYNVQFSPFHAEFLAVATSQPFGSIGGGTLFLLRLNENGSINETKTFDTTDGLFDVAWSKHLPDKLISACGDGSIQLWNTDVDVNANTIDYSKPKSLYREHSKEVCSVDWACLSQNPLFLSSSWDCSIRLWNPEYNMSLKTYTNHTQLVYESKFSKKMTNIFSSVSADGYLKIWDILQPQPISSFKPHRESEVLSCDWNEHNENIIASGGSDGIVKVWDLRHVEAGPLAELYGCELAVRRVRFSPFNSSILASASYDQTTRIWNWQNDCEAIETITNHSESNYGLDWNRLAQNQLADCGWDSVVNIYTPEFLN